MNFKFLFLTLFSFALYTIPITCKCYIDIKNDLDDHAPILHDHQESFIYPTNNSQFLSFRVKQSFQISCPGEGNSFIINNWNFETTSLTITCKGAKEFSFSTPTSKKTFQLKNVRCKKMPKSELRRFNESTVSISNSMFSSCKKANYHHFVSGYAVGENSFLRVFDVCYDQKKNQPIIAFSKILPGINHKQIWKRESSAFSNAGTHRDINSAYLGASQIAYFNQTFGIDQQYLTPQQNFERGHLVPKADFLYQNEQAATFYYTNVAPMWKTINRGHWKDVETFLRNFISIYRTKIDVWTGAFGTLALPDRNNKPVQIFLHNLNSRSDKQIYLQVPKFLFKVVYAPGSVNQKGFSVVFVTINNPYWKFNKKDIICNNIIDKFPWMKLRNPSNYNLGYTYACEYEDFKDKSKLRILPDLPQVFPLKKQNVNKYWSNKI